MVSGPAFRIPVDSLKALGNGDPVLGHAALCDTFACWGSGVGIVPHEALKAIGDGNAIAGRRVLRKFIAIAHRNHAAALKQRIAKAYAEGGAVTDDETGYDVPGVGYVPTSAEPFTKVVRGLVDQFTGLPQRALEASETMRQGGDYDPGPALEAAGLMAGARFPYARAGELGTFGGKLYSAAHEAVQSAPMTQAPGYQWLGYLRNQPGVKADELNWIGTPEFLQAQRGPVSKEALAQHMREQQLELKDVTKSGSGSDPDNFSSPRYANYTLPGGQDYREMLLTMPTPSWYYAGRMDAPSAQAASQLYRSGHWEEPNVLAHVRFNDREIGGKKTLFVEEIQSDWHQEGRSAGYKTGDKLTPGEKEELRSLQRHYDNLRGDVHAAELDRLRQLQDKLEANPSGVPDAPFKTAWPELALKRILKYAADNGYDQIGWTSGATQAARYDLSKQIKSVRFEKSGTSGFTRREDIDNLSDYGRLIATDHNGRKVIERSVHQDELPNFIGKDVAEKLLQADPRYSTTGGTAHNIRELSGLDLRIGGEGMNKFYDEILPATANKLGKKFGARVQRDAMPTGDVSRFGIEHSGGGWRIVDTAQNEGQGTFIGPLFRSGADAERWLKDKGHTDTAVHVLRFTEALKRMAREKGFPLFKRGGRTKAA